tara:strand:- start:226 stop:474 length:249 start_codon:yes stop_codon:yes gene_type:complete
MSDLNDLPASVMGAVRDIMMSNQNLFQKDLENRYAPQQHATPDEVEAVTQNNTVEVPDPAPAAVEIDVESTTTDELETPDVS